MCRYLKVSRAAYYKWLNHQPSKREIEDEAILTYIKQLEAENNFTFGVKRLVMYLHRETNFHASESKMRRIMKQNGIKASIRIARHDRKQEKKEMISQNLLLTDQGHDFKPDQPNQIWVTDCTEIKYGWKYQERLRLSAIKDLFDHSIIAWKIGATETSELVTETFDTAIKATGGVKPTVLHSDQGSSYTSGLFNDHLAGSGVKHSMSRPGTPGDNSPMESLWSHLKTEYFRFHHALNKNELIDLIKKFIKHYNTQRRQITLKGMVPIEYRNHALEKIA